MTFGITMGDSSGVGPEILLKAAKNAELRYPFVVYGDLAVLVRADRESGYGLGLRKASAPRDLRSGYVNVIDHGMVGEAEVQPGVLSALSGRAAREYVISATKAALAGEIAAIVTLPMNKEATQLSDPNFTGHTELIGELCGLQRWFRATRTVKPSVTAAALSAVSMSKTSPSRMVHRYAVATSIS